MKSLSDNHAEGMLTDSSGESSSDKDKDEEMFLDSSTQKSSKAHESNGSIDSGEGEEENTDTSFSNEQPQATESNFSADKVRSASPDNCNLQPSVKNDVYFAPPLTVEYEEHNIVTPKMNNKKKGEGLGNSLPYSLVDLIIFCRVRVGVRAKIAGFSDIFGSVKFITKIAVLTHPKNKKIRVGPKIRA